MFQIDQKFPHFALEVYDPERDDVGKISLADYYGQRIDFLQRSVVESKDLLDQIFVTYTIKRAQEGDDRAFNALFNCYSKAAEGLAVDFIKRKAHAIKNSSQFNDGGSLSSDEAQSAVLGFLAATIKGDAPDVLFRNLDVPPSERKENIMLANRKPEAVLLTAQSDAFTTHAVAAEQFLKQHRVFKRTMKNLNYRFNKAKTSKSRMDYLDKIFSYSHRHLSIIGTGSIMALVTFNPYNLAKFARTRNKWAYTPNKHSNLTTWLFGSPRSKAKNLPGYLTWRLQDWFKSHTSKSAHSEYVSPEDYSSSSDYEINEERTGDPEMDEWQKVMRGEKEPENVE